MTAFTVPGATLDVSLSDEGGQPVVQLHGLTSSRVRDRVLDLDLGVGLSGTRLLRYDARGHGRSTGRPVAEDYRWPNLAADLLALLDEYFPGEQVYGVGTSMGCGTLLHAVTAAPDRFSGLTVLLPPTAWETRKAQSQHYFDTATLIEDQGEAAFLAAGPDFPPPPTTVGRPETVPEVPEDLLPSVFRGAGMSDLPTREAIAAITAPTRVLAWIDDPSHPLSTAITLTELIGDSSLTIAHTPGDVRRWPAMLRDDVSRVHRRGE